MNPVQTAPLDVDAIRRDFPILSQPVHGAKPLIFLDSAASTQRPQQVIDAISSAYSTSYANVHRGIHWLSERATDLYEQARESVRGFLGAEHFEEVIFTSGTTGGINLVARSWGDQNISAGDEIVLTLLEHHSNIVPWQQLQQRTGCKLRFLPIDERGRLDETAWDEAFHSRTRLLACTAVSNVLGTVLPLDKLIARARAVGAKVLIDAAQSVPHSPTQVTSLDADFLVFSGHKMLGPSGIGVLYGKRAELQAMPPFLGGGSMIGQVTTDGFTAADLPAKFEAGTPPIVPAIAMKAAIDYLQGSGLSAIAAHERRLTEHAHEVLGAIPDVQILGPDPEEKAGIVSFVIDGIHAHDVAHILDQRCGIAIRAGHHCAMPLHKALGVVASNRASFYLYNTLDEVDQLGNAILEVKRLFRR